MNLHNRAHWLVLFHSWTGESCALAELTPLVLVYLTWKRDNSSQFTGALDPSCCKAEILSFWEELEQGALTGEFGGKCGCKHSQKDGLSICLSKSFRDHLNKYVHVKSNNMKYFHPNVEQEFFKSIRSCHFCKQFYYCLSRLFWCWGKGCLVHTAPVGAGGYWTLKCFCTTLQSFGSSASHFPPLNFTPQ